MMKLKHYTIWLIAAVFLLQALYSRARSIAGASCNAMTLPDATAGKDVSIVSQNAVGSTVAVPTGVLTSSPP